MGFRGVLTRGPRHRERVASVDIRIVVSGVRGKSSTVKRLHDIFYRRGDSTLAKITGDFPLTIENGDQRPINRHGSRVTLYENHTILRDVVPRLTGSATPDTLIVEHPVPPTATAVFENQAITEYTMRTFNTVFVKPQVILFTNIRQDHNDTLGRTRQRIARSFARSVPEGTHVISGEQHPVIHEYLQAELMKRDATITQVEIPDEHQSLIGAETIHALNTILEYYDRRPLSDQRIEELLARQQPHWIHLQSGQRIFNAAKVNDIESTELFRRALAGSGPHAERVCPFVFLRRDRRGRTASFAEYINILDDRELIDRVHLGGDFTSVFARNITPQAIEHDTERHTAAEVLNRLIEEAWPILLMGNTVHPWMRDLQTEIEHRRAPTFSLSDAAKIPPMDFLWGGDELTQWKQLQQPQYD